MSLAPLTSLSPAFGTGSTANSRCRSLPCPAPADAGLDETVDVAIEYGLRRGDFVLGTQILHHLVRMQHVGAHLRAPAVAAITLERIELCFAVLWCALQ